jgi:hypothetical protein
MEHFCGKLLDGDQVVFEPVEGYLGSHALTNGHKTWFGHFELPIERRASVCPGVRYLLALSDGRIAPLYIDLHDSNSPGKCTAEFQLVGGLKEKRSIRH